MVQCNDFLKNMKEKISVWLQALASFAIILSVGLAVNSIGVETSSAGFLGSDGFMAGLISEVDCPEGAVCNPDFRGTIVTFINYFLTFVGIIAVAFIIYAGLLMIIAGGEEEATTKGKKIIIWAAVGLIIIMISFALVNFVIRAGDSAGSLFG